MGIIFEKRINIFVLHNIVENERERFIFREEEINLSPVFLSTHPTASVLPQFSYS